MTTQSPTVNNAWWYIELFKKLFRLCLNSLCAIDVFVPLINIVGPSSSITSCIAINTVYKGHVGWYVVSEWTRCDSAPILLIKAPNSWTTASDYDDDVNDDDVSDDYVNDDYDSANFILPWPSNRLAKRTLSILSLLSNILS